jgi:hypothetical protein
VNIGLFMTNASKSYLYGVAKVRIQGNAEEEVVPTKDLTIRHSNISKRLSSMQYVKDQHPIREPRCSVTL